MPFGATVTSYLADLFPTDPIAPQVVGDFAQALPPNPIKGELVSHFAQDLFPTDPIRPTDVGQQLSAIIQVLRQPDLGTEGDLFF